MRPGTTSHFWRRRILAGLAAAATAAAGLGAAAAPAQAEGNDGITVYLASDSTVQTYDPYWEPQAGWGQMFDRYFDEKVTVVNRAIGGRSSRSFVDEGRLDAILDAIQPGDYLFVQFGHNDANQTRPERYTPPEDYKTYLRDHYMAGAIAKGAIPVLVTPVSRRNYDPVTGETRAWIPEYVEKVHELHEETGVAMVDLSASSRAYLDEIGPEESKSVFLHVPPGVYPNRPDGTADNTHFQEYGAIQMGRLVAEETATLGLSLSPHVVGVEPPAQVPDAPSNLRAETVSNASVTLLWDEVETDIYRVYVRESGGGSPATGIGTVDDVLQGDNGWRLGTTSTVGKGRVSGLAEEATYDFAVAAVNGKGESEHSKVLTVTTAAAGWKFDVGPASQVTAEGYAEVNRGTSYTAERGYGFVGDMSGAIDRDRGCDSDVGRDFVAWFGGNYEFAVDVPDGRYTARVWVGDCLGSARTNVAFEGDDHGPANAGSKTWATHDFEGIVVEDGQLNMNISGQTGHFNGLELTRVGDPPDGGGGPDEPCEGCVKAVESVDRSPVAVAVDGGVYLGWRKLGNDPDDVSFNVYRNARLIARTDGTNVTDPGGSASARYHVAVVVGGKEVGYTDDFGVWADQYVDIDMDRPAGGTTPDGVDYTYHPNDATVADLDGDGAFELIQKWDPSNAKDNSRSGYTGNVYIDAYTLTGERLWRIDLGVNIRAGAHYTSLSAYDFDDDGTAELALKTGDGTVDGVGNVVGDPDADHRNAKGYIITGPEYLTVFDGPTGTALDTVGFDPERGTSEDWGDGYGNRVDRLMASVAYLDGESPSLITSRGIYTKSEISAWDWDGEQLSQRWEFKSQEHGARYAGQGNHQMSIADVDADGRDEIVYGAMTVNDDGTPLYSSGLGHGDALHVSDFDPDREGQEIFSPFESPGSNGGVGAALRDGETGEVIWSMDVATDDDVGRGACGDIDPKYTGAECWAVTADGRWNSRNGQLKAADGTSIADTIPSANHMIWWDGDLGREIFDHEFNQEAYEPIYPYIAKWDAEAGAQKEIFTPDGVQTNNGTKGNPVLTADLYGDWREELILRKESNDGVRIFTTVIETEHSIPTLMHDPQYRSAIAWQNESYNQPPWPSFHIGYATDPADIEWDAVDYKPVDAAEPPLVAGDCSIGYTVVNDRREGFVVQMKVTNTGEAPITGWQLVFDSSIESISQSWGGDAVVADGAVTVDPAAWNASIDPGGTRVLGFRGVGDPADPGLFLMDGKVCEAA